LQPGGKEKRRGSNFSRELEELDAVDRTSDARGCGRWWTLGTALDQRRLTRTAAALLDGSA